MMASSVRILTISMALRRSFAHTSRSKVEVTRLDGVLGHEVLHDDRLARLDARLREVLSVITTYSPLARS